MQESDSCVHQQGRADRAKKLQTEVLFPSQVNCWMLFTDLQAPIYLIAYIAARILQFNFSAKENHTPGATRSYGVFPVVGNNSRT